MKVPYLCHAISYIEVDICVNFNFSLATIQFNMQCLSLWAGGLNTYMTCVQTEESMTWRFRWELCVYTSMYVCAYVSNLSVWMCVYEHRERGKRRIQRRCFSLSELRNLQR